MALRRRTAVSDSGGRETSLSIFPTLSFLSSIEPETPQKKKQKQEQLRSLLMGRSQGDAFQVATQAQRSKGGDLYTAGTSSSSDRTRLVPSSSSGRTDNNKTVPPPKKANARTMLDSTDDEG